MVDGRRVDHRSRDGFGFRGWQGEGGIAHGKGSGQSGGHRITARSQGTRQEGSTKALRSTKAPAKVAKASEGGEGRRRCGRKEATKASKVASATKASKVDEGAPPRRRRRRAKKAAKAAKKAAPAKRAARVAAKGSVEDGDRSRVRFSSKNPSVPVTSSTPSHSLPAASPRGIGVTTGPKKACPSKLITGVPTSIPTWSIPCRATR